MTLDRQPGAIALVGSGEYLPVMEETDRLLLQRARGAAARVVVLPTASGLEEPGSPARWMRMGVEHFTRLGAQVDAVPILDRASAHEPHFIALIEQADFIYFSGGNPQHLIDSLAGTPAWEAVQRRYRQGASLAGCSAGAMAFCGLTIGRLRALQEGSLPEWNEALGLLPRLIVMPHFDRMAAFVGQEVFARVLAAVPDGFTLVGVDEDTALVRMQDGLDAEGRSAWQVTGRSGVSLFTAGGTHRYVAGQQLMLAVGSDDQRSLHDRAVT